MRRLITITAFALALAVPVWAQHGGGHGGGGHAGGFGGGHAGGFSGNHGGFSGGHISGGFHSGIGSSRALNRGFNRGLSRGFHRGFANRASRGPFLHSGTRVRIRTYGFRNNCYGYFCRWGWGWGYPWWGYYDPWWWDWWDNSGYNDDYVRDRALAEEMNEQNLEEQRMLRQEEADRDQDLYAQRAPTTSTNEKPGAPIYPATVLIFRDQHKQEIQNYAVVGQTLWNFAPQRTERIPLADLDLTATALANEERGVPFRIPATPQAR